MPAIADEIYFQVDAQRRYQGGNRICGWDRMVPYADPFAQTDDRREVAFRAGVAFAEWLAVWAPAKFAEGMVFYFSQGNPYAIEN